VVRKQSEEAMMAAKIKDSDKSRPAAEKDVAREFFIPDLCNVQALLFLVLVAELLAIVLELAASGLSAFSWLSFSLTSLFVQWVFLLCAALLCQIRQRFSEWPLPLAASICYLVIVVVVAITSATGQWLMEGGFNGSGLNDIERILTHVLICAVLAGIVLRYFYLTQQLQLRQRTELQARIQALQSRIRPHFLFNSMNIIASLIAVDQEAAETAVEDLAGLFRASLAEVETEVSFAEELELCRRYVRIEQLRLADRLQIEWRVENVPEEIKIPSLSLQPLLENAIYHGIQPLPQGGLVTISGEYAQGVLTVTITNPVLDHAAMPDVRHRGNRLALDNIHRRLQALYGSKAGLVAKLDKNLFHATIQYPILYEGL
jgi:two-component system sensor histidine kinase AlgZ